jgi:DNA-binding MarR family transcriptional regulator
MADPHRLARVVQICARGFGRIGRERAHSSGITLQQADALELIEACGVVSTSAFAHLLGIDPSTASRNLTGLQHAGLVVRKRDPQDSRQTEVRLTPKGKRAAETLSSEVARTFSELLERVPRADRQRVSDALALLARAVTAGEARP